MSGGSRRIDQMVAGFADGDAISGEALLLRDLLRGLGFGSEIFADPAHVAPRMAGQCRRLDEYAGASGDALIGHYSIGSPSTAAFQGARAKKILLYHNITPAHFFRGFDDGVALQLERAREDLKTTAGHARAVWADSRFNASEIEALGIGPVRVFELLFSPAAFDAPPDPATLRKFTGAMKNLLFVGRIAPNKRVEDLMLAFAWYNKSINPFSRLIVVGSDRSCPRYYAMLRMLAGELDLPNVGLEGFLSQEGISACYRRADAFVCASEHEGYCLPLVEAMHHGVPVIARNTGGIPEALGGAGVLYEDLSPQLLAELIHRVLSDGGLRSEILASQKARMEKIRQRNAREEIQALLKDSL